MEYPTPRMTLIGILKFDEGIKLEYSDPNWNIWGSKALIGISPYNIIFFNLTAIESLW
eukprot:COSAG01_NODE_1377_length_10527_cov_806.883679_11_plen_58_part_00